MTGRQAEMASAAGGADDPLIAPHPHRQFRLELPGLPPDALEVETLACDEHAVDADYRFDVAVVSRKPLDARALLGASARLALGLGDAASVIHGVVVALEQTGEGDIGHEGRLRLHSPLWLLTHAVHHRVFRRRTAPEIATAVLEAALPDGVRVQAEVGRDCPQQPMVVQNDEPDAVFLQRVLSRDGLLLLVRQEADGPVAVIHDDLAQAVEGCLDLTYQRQSGQVRGHDNTVHALRHWDALQPAGVRVADFDPAYPQDNAPGLAEGTSGAGRVELFGQRGGGREACRALAGVHLAAWNAQREGVEIETACRHLGPGVRIRLSGHPDDAVNGEYVTVSASHHGDQAAALKGGEGAGRPTYRCVARLLPVAVPYRAAPVERPAAGAGLLVGEVEGRESGQAHLDQEGAYRVRLALDEGDADTAEASPPVRMAQPYGGADYGLHFPLLPKTRVAMAGLNGDSERPVILGALPSDRQRPPVTTENPHHHVLRTPAGHAFCLDDRPGTTRLSLTAAKEAGSLVMEQSESQRRVALTTEEGSMALTSGGDLTVRSGGDRRVEVEGDYAASVVGDHTLRAERGAVVWSASDRLELSTDEGDLLQEAVEGDAGISAGGELRVEAGGGLSMRATEGDAAMIAEAGALDLEVDGDLALVSTGDGDIAIGQSGGLRICGNGDVVLDGEEVSISGDRITLTASDIAEN